MPKRLLFLPLICLLTLTAYSQSPDPALLKGNWRHLENGQATLLQLDEGGHYRSGKEGADMVEEGSFRLNRQFLAFYGRQMVPSDAAETGEEALALPDAHFSFKVVRLDAQYLELEDPRDQSHILYERERE